MLLDQQIGKSQVKKTSNTFFVRKNTVTEVLEVLGYKIF